MIKELDIRIFAEGTEYKAQNLMYLLAKYLADVSPESRESVKVVFRYDEHTGDIHMKIGIENDRNT